MSCRLPLSVSFQSVGLQRANTLHFFISFVLYSQFCSILPTSGTLLGILLITPRSLAFDYFVPNYYTVQDKNMNDSMHIKTYFVFSPTLFMVVLSDTVCHFSRHPFLSKYGGVDDVWPEERRFTGVGSSWLLEP